MGNNKEAIIRGIMGRTGYSYEEAEAAYKESMRVIASRGGKNSTHRPFTDPDKARKAQKKSVKARLKNKKENV